MKNELTRAIIKRFRDVFIPILALCLCACGGSKSVKEEPFEPEAYLSKAETLISDNDYEEARKALLEVKNRDTTKKYAPLAQLKIADSYIKEKEHELGIEEYRKFMEFYPDNQYASYAQYQIAMAYFTQIESPDRGSGAAEKALKEFLKLKELYPRNPYKEVLALRIEKCRNLIADGAFLIGQFYYNKGSYKAAISRFDAILKQFPDYKREEDVLMFLGRSYKELKMNDKAKEVFNRFLEKYPASRFASEAKKGAL